MKKRVNYWLEHNKNPTFHPHLYATVPEAYNIWRSEELTRIHLGAYTKEAERIDAIGRRLHELEPLQFGKGIDGKEFFKRRMQSGTTWHQRQAGLSVDSGLFRKAFHDMANLKIEEE